MRFHHAILLRVRSIALLCFFSVQIGIGQVPFTSSSAPFTMSMTFPARMLPGDFDNDGDIDLLYQSGNVAGAGFGYEKNLGGGSYQLYADATASGTPFTSFDFDGQQLAATGMFVFDYDNDGDVDIIDRDSAGGLGIWRNNSGSFAIATNTLTMTMTFASRMLPGDFDNDGDIDILYQNGSVAGAGIGYAKNNGSGTFTPYSDATVSGTPFTSFNFNEQQITPASMFVFDYDNDGDDDIIDRDLIASTGIWKNNSGSFAHATNTLNMSMSFPPRMVYGDFDSDGDIDVLYQTSNTAGTGFGYMKNTGNGTFDNYSPGNLTGTPFSNINFDGLNLGAGFFVFDTDNDGDVEIIDRFNTGSGGLRVWSRSGSPPRLTVSVPAKGASNFSPKGNIVLTFNRAVNSGGGNVYIRKSAGVVAAVIPTNGSMVTGANTTVITVNPAAELEGLTSYYLTFDKNAFVDQDGQIFGVLPTGGIATRAITSSSFLSFTTDAVLPVHLVYFKASALEGQTQLRWRTASALNTSHFQIENSTDGKVFKIVGSVVRKGTDFSREDYQFLHESPDHGAQFYRLKMVDWDGSFAYSNLEVVRFSDVQDLKVYPNPVAEKVEIQWDRERYQTADLLDLNGRILIHGDLRDGQRRWTQQVGHLAPGIYLLKLRGREANRTVKFVKE